MPSIYICRRLWPWGSGEETSAVWSAEIPAFHMWPRGKLVRRSSAVLVIMSHSIKNPVCGRYLCAKVYGEKDREKRFFSWLHSAVYNCAQNLISAPRPKNNLVFEGSLHLYKFPSLKKTTTTYFEFIGRVKSQAIPYQALPATRETSLMFSSSGGCSLFI